MSSSGQTNQQAMDDSVQKKLAEEQRINDPVAMRNLAEDLYNFQIRDQIQFVALPQWRKYDRQAVRWVVSGPVKVPPWAPKK
ncbi:uncharacterized protein Triagg1_8868 [Trichoderma aggressivum f. europaeum]|uniref:Uncharacterized protein n=1 Tax=Trichoderma aggressivum f. europaeum TaxID=173218 RepID=A0AAE1I7Q9_9HYPO|nr:hypothetical protein Triagg1_8868 [Trichoderma aggressivum f. europaeum]